LCAPRDDPKGSSAAGSARFSIYDYKGGVFSEHFYLRTCPAHPIRAHTCPGITRRLCGWLGASGTQGLRALGLSQGCRQSSGAHSAVELHGCCARVLPGCRLQRRPSANILTAWPGRVAQAPRAGRARAPWSCSPSHVGAHRREDENRTVRGSARARRRSELANSPLRCHRQPGCRGHLSRRFASFQRQRGPADPRETTCSAPRPPYVSINLSIYPSLSVLSSAFTLSSRQIH
jgi:hypothetical protein